MGGISRGNIGLYEEDIKEGGYYEAMRVIKEGRRRGVGKGWEPHQDRR
jgi:hypothetical protein